MTALHWVVKQIDDWTKCCASSEGECFKVAKCLLDKGCNVNAATRLFNGGETVLNMLIRSTCDGFRVGRFSRRHLQIFDLLLERGADVNGGTASFRYIFEAVSSNSPYVIRELVACKTRRKCQRFEWPQAD